MESYAVKKFNVALLCINLSGAAAWTNNGGGVVANPGQWLLNAIGL